ncbi:MAG: hypothetical protein AB7P03_15550 [Kofleriaceae bacterium]
MARLAIALVLASVASACLPTIPHATPSDAQRSNIELAQLQEGRGLMIRKCSGCHRTPLPSDHTAHEWPTMLDEMSERSKLDARERQLIEQYFVVMARR